MKNLLTTTNSSARSAARIVSPVSAVQQHVKDFSTNISFVTRIGTGSFGQDNTGFDYLASIFTSGTELHSQAWSFCSLTHLHTGRVAGFGELEPKNVLFQPESLGRLF